MKSTGIVRRIDELGRVVLPKELRRTLNIDNLDPLEIFVNGEMIVLRKYTPGCVLCGNTEDLKQLSGKLICRPCATEAVKLLGTR
ncbi:AbrB/MazE/SpoVT family DNA-binding domain-containing protein [Paenibacillus sp. NFR01]|uniref:AbrB/MazE/SpoVT family DNA-binding domain-containing protein n=1 Tax=Paenibacillus sp. NFR01 TaxID=1566279 RepID=UPI0008B735EC|nr:AbrB/MazE/SpoVT family DNA-binding domain-containing protein [Paenibacillus sp. NFR01]SEU32546.1 transcriptional pleiotropic regulator of transition state genes [Paenibacillus sp. NFR01]